MRAARKPEIMADAAYAIFAQAGARVHRQFPDRRHLPSENGVTDFEPYRVDPAQKLVQDFFVPADSAPPKGVTIERPFG